MMRALIVINPNASACVMAGIDAAMEPLGGFGMPITCVTLEEGPPGSPRR